MKQSCFNGLSMMDSSFSSSIWSTSSDFNNKKIFYATVEINSNPELVKHGGNGSPIVMLMLNDNNYIHSTKIKTGVAKKKNPTAKTRYKTNTLRKQITKTDYATAWMLPPSFLYIAVFFAIFWIKLTIFS